MPRRQYGTGSVFQRADGRWVGRVEAGFTRSGTRRRVVVIAKTEAAAKVRLKEKQRQIALDGNPEAGLSRATVKSFTEEWLTGHVRTVRPKTYATDASAARRWVTATIGHRRLDALTPGDVRAVGDAIRKAGLSTTTANRAHGVLLRILKAAILQGHPIPARFLLIPAPGLAATDRDDIPLADALKILEAASVAPNAARWVAALLNGMRPAEALGLTWDAVDLEHNRIDISWQLQPLPYLDRAAGTFRVPDGHESRHLKGAYHLVRPKTKKGYRVVPIMPWLRAALVREQDAHPNPWGLVWLMTDTRPGHEGPTPTNARADRQAWWALQDAAKVRHPSGRHYDLYEARHTTATLLLEAGVDPQVVIAIMGHSNILVTRVYQHVGDAPARAALEQVASRLGLGPA